MLLNPLILTTWAYMSLDETYTDNIILQKVTAPQVCNVHNLNIDHTCNIILYRENDTDDPYVLHVISI